MTRAVPPAAAEWQESALGPRARLFQTGADKFKTCAVRVHLHVPLAADTVTATALVPHVLGRGCRGYPDLTAIHRRLEELYGAGVGAGVTKLGEVQSLFLGLDVVQGRYLPDDVLPAAVDLLGRMCLEPELDGGGAFPEQTVRQEKDNLANRIRGAMNDKVRYAALRCVEEMCGGEPYALNAQGRLADLPAISAEAVAARWRALLAEAAVDVFAVGGGPELGRLLADALGPLTRGVAGPVGTRPGAPPHEPRRIVETDDVNQGKLCLGYRTAVTRRDPRYPAMVLYAAILGGFPHSKLFRHVREKASLAYYASAQWDALKGVLLIHSGIDPERFDQALDIIRQQVEAMAAGRIDGEELEFSKRGLVNQLRAAEDAPASLLDAAVGQALVGDLRPLAQRVAEIEAVTREQVVEVAGQVWLDTIYFLTERGADGPAGGDGR